MPRRPIAHRQVGQDQPSAEQARGLVQFRGGAPRGAPVGEHDVDLELWCVIGKHFQMGLRREALGLPRLGAHDSVLAWEERRMRREVRATANRLANFDDANLRRSARAAVAAGARVERALEILGSDAPEHLTVAGRLRIEHRQASLEELGQLASPPLTKDAIAGRIRRLLAMADKRARDLGVPDTESSLTPEMLTQ